MAELKTDNQNVCPTCFDPFPLQELFNEKEMTDCSFVFTKENQKTNVLIETSERIHAHKLVLAVHSTVFKEMLYGPHAEKKNVFTINDISSDVFHSMLKYVYTKESIQDNEKNLFDLYKAVNKYEFWPVLKKLEEKLISTLSIANALETYEFVEQFQKPEMMKKIVAFIQENTLLILEHESFVQIQRSTLNFVLSQQKVNAVEIQLFNACLRWAKVKCARRGVEKPTPGKLRKTLGKELFLIRIPTMNAKHFMQGPAASGMLEMKEQNELVKYIMSSNCPKTSSDFISRFKLDARQWQSSHFLSFSGKFKRVSLQYSAMEAVSSLQFKSSDDVLLMGFNFADILGDFTIAKVTLFEDSMSILSNEKLTSKSLKNKEGVDTGSHSVEFNSPLFISAGLTYNLSIYFEFDKVCQFSQKIQREVFESHYERKFAEKNSILLEFVNKTQFCVYIYGLSIH